MKADELRAERYSNAQFEAQMVVINKIIEDMSMNEKKFPLSINDVFKVFRKNNCKGVETIRYSIPDLVKFSEISVQGKDEDFLNSLQAIIDKHNQVQQQPEKKKIKEDMAHFIADQIAVDLKNIQIEVLMDAAKRCKENADRMCNEISELKRQLAAAQNDVKQLRARRGKRLLKMPPMLLTTPKQGDGWIEWNGSASRPSSVPLGTRIEYKLRGGFVDQRPCVTMLIWHHDGTGSDIVAYRTPK